MAAIVIQVGEEQFRGELSDTDSPHTTRKILDALPLSGRANTWGDEIYFEIPIDVAEENARAVLSKGDLGYWPAGNCFCVFYGRTPMSPSEEEIVPASPVNLIGRIEDPDRLKGHPGGEQVVIRLAEPSP